MMGFSRRIGYCSEGLKLALSMGARQVILESDSKVLVDGLNGNGFEIRR